MELPLHVLSIYFNHWGKEQTRMARRQRGLDSLVTVLTKYSKVYTKWCRHHMDIETSPFDHHLQRTCRYFELLSAFSQHLLYPYEGIYIPENVNERRYHVVSYAYFHRRMTIAKRIGILPSHFFDWIEDDVLQHVDAILALR